MLDATTSTTAPIPLHRYHCTTNRRIPPIVAPPPPPKSLQPLHRHSATRAIQRRSPSSQCVQQQSTATPIHTTTTATASTNTNTTISSATAAAATTQTRTNSSTNATPWGYPCGGGTTKRSNGAPARFKRLSPEEPSGLKKSSPQGAPRGSP